jgi:hypothetical protein
MEIIIGRCPQGQQDIKVPESFNKVSRKHAKIIKDDGKLTITDLNSSNGTFVNGMRIVTKVINENDVVLLGDTNEEYAYRINIRDILNEPIVSAKANQEKTDYSQEFQRLINVYKAYHKEVEETKKKLQQEIQLKRILIPVGIGFVLLILTLSGSVPEEKRMVLYPVMIIIMALASYLTSFIKMPDLRDIITEIEMKYRVKYVCPKCKKPFNINIHWKKLENHKICPYKCGAVFVK